MIPYSSENKSSLGQFLTINPQIQDTMSKLIHTDFNGKCLEPSAGRGHLVAILERCGFSNITAIELDDVLISQRVCKTNIKEEDFFFHANQMLIEKYTHGYDCIIGNPPYVKLKNVCPSTRKLIASVYPGNSNLYCLFMEECIKLLKNKGELIFIVPKEWLYNTSASHLRSAITNTGTITDFIDCGEEKVFEDASLPSLCIFRYEKNKTKKCRYYESLNDFQHQIYYVRSMKIINSALTFLPVDLISVVETAKPLSVYFDVKVGSVTGADKIFGLTKNTLQTVDTKNVEYVMTTKQVAQPFLNVNKYDAFDVIPHKTQQYLLKHKEALLKRKIAVFGENNWWKYGAIRNDALARSSHPRIFCLAKTRKSKVFWIGNPGQVYGGGVLALYPKNNVSNLETITNALNSITYRRIFQSFNLMVNNKINLTQSILEKVPLLTTTNKNNSVKPISRWE